MKNFVIFIMLMMVMPVCRNITAQITADTTNTEDPTPPGTVIDEVVAVVGKNYILLSDIENQYIQVRLQGGIEGSESTVKCTLLENLLFEKLMLHQAAIDSIEVTPEQVEGELDRRMRYFIGQFGSQEKLEKFYDKTVVEFKSELREVIVDQMKAERVQQNITEGARVSPTEVRAFFKNLQKDSIPLIGSVVEISQIVKKPPISAAEKFEIKEKLRKLRDRVVGGESFEALARLYSEDPGSAKLGGDIGLHGRGELYPEFEAAAFKLKPGELSDIVESEAGYHLIQGIERRGDYVRVRHILLKPKVSPLALDEARVFLDSVAALIRHDSLTFDEAVKKFSTDPSKNNNGYLINPNTGSTQWPVDQLEPKIFFIVDKLIIGEVSAPVLMTDDNGEESYRLLYLNKRTEPHRANLTEDYDQIQMWALQARKQEAMKKWISQNAKKTYIKINEKYQDCEFQQDWF